ncbi:MAG: glycosyl transferase [Deltaproteobacteria bacterium]|nr:glycosyl transferase [Deltaproteobacteria bacterium]
MFTKEINNDRVNEVEIVVGIPSYNEAENISLPTAKANEGMLQYSGDPKSVIINCDNNSTDSTRDAFLGTPTEISTIYISTPPGIKGKGHNLRNLFTKAIDLKAKAIVVVDADLKSITPQWIKHLCEPILKNFGFVAPLYVRHKYDGTITNSIAYPMTRTLYGRRVRQPIGGDFAFNGKLAELYVKSTDWNEYISQFGIDVWMTTLAMNNGLPICQAFMGRPKLHKHKNPGLPPGSLFKQVVSTIFDLMVTYAPFWKRVRWSKPTAIFGFGLGEVEMPPAVNVDQGKLFKLLQSGWDQYHDLWRETFSDEVYNKIEEIREMGMDRFEYPAVIWAKTIFDSAVAYKNQTCPRDNLVEALIPLYYGKTLSFVRKTERLSIQQAEEFIEHEATIFEESKPYLVERWPA